MPSASIPAAIAAAFTTTTAAAGTAAAVSAGSIAAGSALAAAGTVASTAAIGAGTAAGAITAGSALAGAGAAAASIAAATVPSWLSVVGNVGTVTNLIGGAIGASGANQSAQAQAEAAKYNAEVAANNQQTALNNATLTAQAGAQQVATQQLKTRATVGAITANAAASGLDVNSDSPLDVRSSTSQLGELDALTVRSNATKQAYGYQTQAANYGAEVPLYKQEAGQDITAGNLSATSTLLNSAGTAATNFAKFQLSGGFSADNNNGVI